MSKRPLLLYAETRAVYDPTLGLGGAALVEHGLEELVRLLRLLALAKHGDELDVYADVRPVPHLVPH